MKRLIKLLRNSDSCVVFTGAGVSTFSGIKDFRGKNGLYKQKNIDADKIFNFAYFQRDPSYYYTKTKDFIYNLDEKEPGIVHKELARLEKMGMVKAVITQNIDLLHQKAGSVNVVEVHGSPKIHSCLTCGKIYTYDEIAKIVKLGNIPKCSRCRGIIKPDITFFGENLPPEAVNKAIKLTSAADLILVLGSTLTVQPAASFPEYTLKNGGKLVIVNDMPTPLDSQAEILYDSLETVFNHLAENI